MNRPTVLVPREASTECPWCFKPSQRRVRFEDGRTGWYCYACAHTSMVTFADVPADAK